MLSFKKTHLMERMSLLTLIVIGEGAIGVTKTVSRMMGKSGLDVESCFLIMCIILVLVSLTVHWVHGQLLISFYRSYSGRSTLTTSPTATMERSANKYGPACTSRFNWRL